MTATANRMTPRVTWEEQDERGVPRYRLLVSPEVGALDEAALAETFLGMLSGLRPAYGFMVNQWRQGRFLTVERTRPRATPRGKVPPVCPLRP